MSKRTLKDVIGKGIAANEVPELEIWLRKELAKMVSEADCNDLIYTSFDQNLATGVKNAIILHIYTEWQL